MCWRTNLEDPAFVDKMTRFVRASMKGWKWAEENPEDAAMIVLDNDETGAQTEEHQIRMMGEMAKLTAGSNGALDPADYERTVASRCSGRRLGPGDHQGPRGRLDPRNHRRGALSAPDRKDRARSAAAQAAAGSRNSRPRSTITSSKSDPAPQAA
jgi:hypothetical protein